MDRQRQTQFAALWQEHQAIARKIAFVYARSREDRRDLVQDIAVQLWRSFAGFDPARAKFSTWMYRIALNVAISQWRHDDRRQTDRLVPLEARHLETIGGGDDIDVGDQQALLHACIDQLGALDRALILLYLEDRSHADMADILGLSKTNVATRINRITQKLRGRMTAAGPCPAGA